MYEFESDHEEDYAEAGMKLGIFLDCVAREDLEKILHPLQLDSLDRIMEIYRRAAEKASRVCDGKTAWGIAEGVGIGRRELLSEIYERAEVDKRGDITQWLSAHHRHRL